MCTNSHRGELSKIACISGPLSEPLLRESVVPLPLVGVLARVQQLLALAVLTFLVVVLAHLPVPLVGVLVPEQQFLSPAVPTYLVAFLIQQPLIFFFRAQQLFNATTSASMSCLRRDTCIEVEDN